jgi:serine/threonine protein kinase
MAKKPKIETLDDFLQVLEKSGLLETRQQDALKKKLHESSASAVDVARWLVKQQLLSKWQANQLLAGVYRLKFGKYTLCDQIGRGEHGVVYQAQHEKLSTRVAVKVLASKVSAEPEAAERFLSEVRTAASLEHPRFVRIHDVANEGNRTLVVMEFVEGQDLKTRVQEQGPLPVDQAVDLVKQAAEGLLYAHQQGVVHGDLKPANLLVDAQGQLKMLDTGLSRLQTGSLDSSTASVSQDLAAISFAAPEQISGKLEPSADVYALGGTLYYLLTGWVPFAAQTDAQRQAMLETQRPVPLAELKPDTPAYLVELWERMTARDPAQRPASMEAILQVLAKPQASPPPPANLAEKSASTSATPTATAETAAIKPDAVKPAPIKPGATTEEAVKPETGIRTGPADGATKEAGGGLGGSSDSAVTETAASQQSVAPVLATAERDSTVAAEPEEAESTLVTAEHGSDKAEQTQVISETIALDLPVQPAKPAVGSGKIQINTGAAKPAAVVSTGGFKIQTKKSAGAGKPVAAAPAPAAATQETIPAQAADSGGNSSSSVLADSTPGSTPVKPAAAGVASTAKSDAVQVAAAAKVASAPASKVGATPQGATSAAAKATGGKAKTGKAEKGPRFKGGDLVEPQAKAAPAPASETPATTSEKRPLTAIFQNKWVLLGGGAACLLLVIFGGTAALLVMLFSGGKANTEVAQVTSKEGTAETADAEPAAEAIDPENMQYEVEIVDDQTPAPAAASAPAEQTDSTNSTPAANAESPQDATTPATTPAPATPAPATPPANNMASTTPAPAATTAGADPEKPPATEKTPTEPAPAPAAEKPAEPAAPPPPPKPPAKPAGPVFVFAPFVELPALPSSGMPVAEAAPIGKINIAESDLCFISLAGGDGAARGRINFELRNAKNGTAPRDWDIVLKDATSETIIATLALPKNELLFQWTDAAGQQASADALRNCALKITAAAEKPYAVSLRKPAADAGYELDLSKPNQEARWAIAALPDPSAIKIEPTLAGQPFVLDPNQPMEASKGIGWLYLGKTKEDAAIALKLESSVTTRGIEVTIKPHLVLPGQDPQPLNKATLNRLRGSNAALERRIAEVGLMKSNIKSLPKERQPLAQAAIAEGEQQIEAMSKAIERIGQVDQIMAATKGTKLNVKIVFRSFDGQVILLETS